MPIYVYGCSTCHVALEKEHGMTDKKRYACPTCGGILTSMPGKKGIQFLKRTDEVLKTVKQDGHQHNDSGSCCWHRVEEIIARQSESELDE